MAKKIFIFSFIFACLFQGLTFSQIGMVDFETWTDQSRYVQENDPEQFNFLRGYAHPGGPIIESTVFLHSVFGLSYENSLMIFMIIICGLATAGSVALCYALRKNILWCIVALITLSINWMYNYSSPPSTIAALLICFLCMFSWYLYEKEKIKPFSLACLSVLMGLTVSTRVDIGSIAIIAFLFFLKPKLSWRQIFYIFIGIGISFILFDPFMWFMPFKHIYDLYYKIIYHYEYFTPTPMSFSYLADFSILPFISAVLSIIFLKINKEIKSPVPSRLILIWLATTIALYAVFLTARYKSARYFLPLILIWDVFLPLFVFTLTEKIKPAFARVSNVFFATILIAYPAAMITVFYFTDKIYNVLYTFS